MDLTDGLIIPAQIGNKPVRLRKNNRSSRPALAGRGFSFHSEHLEPSLGTQMTLELLPFGNVMAYQLKRKGFNVKNLSHRDLVALYYNEFVSNKENQNNSYKPISSYEFRNNAAFKIRKSDSYNGDLESAVNQTHFSAVSNIVDRVVKHFKVSQLKKRYAFENGQDPRESLTDDELIQAAATDRVMSHLEGSVLNDKPVNQGQLINLIFWIALIIALWYILE